MTTRYAIQDHSQIITAGILPAYRPHVYKIHDLPDHKKPREKLFAGGPESLSTQELFAVVLNTGTRKESILEMTSRLVREYGEKSLIGQKDPRALAKDMGIPETKAAQVVACAELGRRFFDKTKRGVSVIRTAKDVYNYAYDIRELSKEHLRGIYLNSHHRVIHDEVISIGTVDANIVHPREVFKPAFDVSAVALVLVHNHPSGSTKASAADIEVTKRLIEVSKFVGIELLDHVIVTKNRFASVPVDYRPQDA